jgi:D-alanyl-D-alanine carboxypeptidase/D-alanyl-D-alanine-endopeptidase (penicillin-binding protein 4)
MMISNSRNSRLLSLLLFLSLSLTAVVPVSVQGQSQQRERRASSSGGSSIPSVAQVAATRTTSTSPPRTVEELRMRIQDVLRRPELAPAQVAVKVASLDTGRTLYEENAGKLMLPASVMKIYTVAAALDRLSPDYRFKTSVYAPARPDASGTVRGDLKIYGRGDPTIAATFNNGDYYKAIDELAASIAAAGVRRVEGDLVGDESYFTGPPLGFAWSWADLQWYYGAEVSALTVNDNALDLFVKPGAGVGAQCSVTTGPVTPLVTIVNRTTTTARGSKRDLSVYRAIGENVIEVGGSLPLDDKGYTGDIAISHPALLFVYMLRAALSQRGVTITGKSRTIDAPSLVSARLPSTSALVELASRQSPPLGVIAAQTLKPSQNLYAELILRTLGREVGANADLTGPATSEGAGVQVVKNFLREARVDQSGVVMVDGSGLSRRDLITASATVQLLTYMSGHRYAAQFRDALPIAGVDGTLSKRMKGTPAANNVRAKTGTIETCATLSGYVTSAAGEHLVFSVLLNNYPEDSGARRTVTDEIAVLLASFSGKP